jgi:hypothetical protein
MIGGKKMERRPLPCKFGAVMRGLHLSGRAGTGINKVVAAAPLETSARQSWHAIVVQR